MISLVFIILGLISGSFLNVLIYRLPLNKSFIFSRSICTNCKSTIPIYRNIPVISFILQLGKCHSCSNSISLQYPLVEILTSLLWYWGGTNLILSDAILFILLTNILIVISFIDYRTMEINLGLIFLSLLILFIYGMVFTQNINNMLFGALVGFGYLGFIFIVTSLIFKKGTMGLGDLQLIIILGAWIGPGNILASIFLASLIGVIFWFAINLVYEYDSNRPLPFAPFLSLSATVVYMMKINVLNYLIGY